MKSIIFVIPVLLIILSCWRNSSPPSKEDVEKALTERIYSKDQFSIYSDGPFSPGFPPEIKHITILKIASKKGYFKKFDAIAVVQARENSYAIPRRDFIDTIQLEMSKVKNIWLIENMKHRVKYSEDYDKSYLHF